jgi:adhesin transport system outer membrane protein
MSRCSLSKLNICFVFSILLWSHASFATSAKASRPSHLITMDMPKNSLDTQKDFLVPKESIHEYRRPSQISATTLNKIIKEALIHHPSIEADKEALSAQDDLIEQATAGYKPSIDLRMSLGRDNFRRSFTINSINPLPSTGAIALTRTDPSITIRQILFDGMGTASRVDRAHSQRHQARGTLGVTTDTATVEAASATIDVRRLQRLLRIVNNNIQFHQIMKEKVAEIVQAGATTISDLHQVEARLQDTHIAKSNIESELSVARAKFVEAVGMEPPTHIKRVRLPAYLLSASAEMSVRMALDKNSSIKVAKSNVHIAETIHRESASKLVPTISLEFEGERDRNTGSTTGYQNRLTAMLVARHNLYNGGSDLAKSRETVKRLTEAHARLNLARRQIERTVRAAWGEAKNARNKSIHLTKLIREKRHIRNSYLNEFTLGKRTLIDLLDAANDVFITEATRTGVDATADVNTITLSVGTAQFGEYLQKSENDELEGNDSEKSDFEPTLYSPESESPLYLAPYQTTSLKTELKKKMKPTKNTSLKRKSIFEQRKEMRLNDLQAKLSV